MKKITTSSRPTVLVVDDAQSERNLLVQVMRKWGYPVKVASRGDVALQLIVNQGIRLVLADWHMPGLMGTELCIRLRQMQLTHDTYLILMSAASLDEFLMQALEAGADDVLPKPIDINELEARLHSAVRRIALQDSLFQQNQRLEKAYQLIEQDLTTVSRLQRSYLPEPICPYPELNYSWLSIPSQYVSGDHLNVFALNPHTFGFYVLDVSGHGIPAAVKSMQLVQMFADHSDSGLVFESAPSNPKNLRQWAKPSQVVARLNRMFQQTPSDLSYFTIVYGVFETETGTLTFCQAGHPSPLILRATGQVEVVGEGGYPVGLFEHDEYIDTQLQLNPQDTFMLYSDGVTEVVNAEGEPFGEARLLDFLQNQWQLSQAAQCLQNLEHTIKAWGGKPISEQGFEDDVSILTLALAQATLAMASEPATTEELQRPQATMFRSQMPAGQALLEQLGVQENSSHELSILMVDDSRSFLHLFKAMLKSWGYQVHLATNGQEAIQLIEDKQPDFVITDWDMPSMNGIELCQQIRAHQHNSYVYIIMVTGFATRSGLSHSLHVGADDFLTKPVNPGELKLRLKTAQRISKLHKELAFKHLELSALYQALQRDMQEVGRIQRALMPKNRAEWPVVTQTLYWPRRYVCSKQMGILQTRDNELGFFMLSLPGEGTSPALQAMALARWFSVERATSLLFPVEETSSKKRRYLVEPDVVWQQLHDLFRTAEGELADFDLLYGLLNLDQGSLLVAGIGSWSLALAAPNQPIQIRNSLHLNKHQNDAAAKPVAVLYRNVIAPGTRFFVLPDGSCRALHLGRQSDWESILQTDSSALEQDFAQLSLRVIPPGQPQSLVWTDNDELDWSEPDGQDVALMGFQWRTYFAPQQLDVTTDQRHHWQQVAHQLLTEPLSASANPSEGYFLSVQHTQPITLGELLACQAWKAVADTANMALLGQAICALLTDHQCDEQLIYNVDLVVAEALSNIMNHGFLQQHPKPVELIVLVYTEHVVIVMRDQGRSIPQDILHTIRSDMNYMDDLALNELPEGGMGLTFIRMVTQRFWYQSKINVEGAYNQLALVLAKN